ncbi:MAG: rRNA (guanine527-N7)-methyltransferase [Nocardioidaceae bacterium]|jgi:16S rRNA (guanine527-N7)-methyltransferase|nr:rRNA (guanine527-N7)-methyltransferase [Nocardioidaceae bacterium]
MPVSRETERPDDELIAAWFGAGTAQIERYAWLLATEGVRRGLIGPRELPRLWTRHILNCVVVHGLIAQGRSVADLGSGAGLPGVVLAVARPDLSVTLIEPLLRRTRFLEEVTADLELSNLTTVRARAEELRGRVAFDVVVARAVAPLDRLARLALPLCRPGGELLAIKGSSASAELEQSAAVLARLRAGQTSIQTCGAGVVEPATTVVRILSQAPERTQKGRS